MNLTDPRTGKVLERLERVRYAYGQLLGLDDFQTEQDYFRQRLRRHNLLLHGWGIVFGLDVAANSEPWRVVVEPGYAIDGQGEEIVVDAAQVADARPHCHGRAHCALYVAVRYRATPACPVPTAVTPENQEEGTMQYSRWADGFELALLEQCPTSEKGLRRESPESEENNPWLVLGRIAAEPNGKITVQDCPQRRPLRPIEAIR